MSGQRKYADTLWECYYEDADAVVFVVDAAESDAAVEEARVALTEALVRAPKASSKEGKKTKKKPPLAVFANKSDVPAARTASELASAMRLTGESDALAGRAWHVGACCARTGRGCGRGSGGCWRSVDERRRSVYVVYVDHGKTVPSVCGRRT